MHRCLLATVSRRTLTVSLGRARIASTMHYATGALGMALVGVTEAARLTGKGRQTIYRAIEAGTLSATRDAHGRATVDIAELERVYGPLQRPEASRDAPPEALADGAGHLAVLEERVRQLEDRVQDQRRELDTVRDEKGRLLALLEASTRALVDRRGHPGSVASVGVVETMRRWLFGGAPRESQGVPG